MTTESEIEEYIREELRKGTSAAVLKEALSEGGADSNIVDEVIIKSQNRKTEQKAGMVGRKSRKWIAYILVVVVAIGLGAVLVTYYSIAGGYADALHLDMSEYYLRLENTAKDENDKLKQGLPTDGNRFDSELARDNNIWFVETISHVTESLMLSDIRYAKQQDATAYETAVKTGSYSTYLSNATGNVVGLGFLVVFDITAMFKIIEEQRKLDPLTELVNYDLPAYTQHISIAEGFLNKDYGSAILSMCAEQTEQFSKSSYRDIGPAALQASALLVNKSDAINQCKVMILKNIENTREAFINAKNAQDKRGVLIYAEKLYAIDEAAKSAKESTGS